MKMQTNKPNQTIYNYDFITKEMINETQCELDPIDNLPLVPGFATQIAPPSCLVTEKCVFDETLNQWIIEQDNRGVVYDITTQEPSEYNILGKLPNNLTKLSPTPNQKWDSVSKTWVTDLVKLVSLKKQEIETAYQTEIDKGALYSGATFQCDSASIQALNDTLTAISNGWSLPTTFEWIDSNNNPHLADIVWLKGL